MTELGCRTREFLNGLYHQLDFYISAKSGIDAFTLGYVFMSKFAVNAINVPQRIKQLYDEGNDDWVNFAQSHVGVFLRNDTMRRFKESIRDDAYSILNEWEKYQTRRNGIYTDLEARGVQKSW